MFTFILLVLVLFTLISIDSSLRKKLKNDERIINRLDLIWKEVQENKKQDN